MAPQYAKDQPQGYHNYIKNIAIVGAGGHSGSHMVEQLLKGGKHHITALTRADSNNTMPSGVTVKVIDYDNLSTITSALQGQDALIITMVATAPSEQQKKLFQAAADAKVPWVLPNEWGGVSRDTPSQREVGLGPRKAKEREFLEELGVSSWIGVACGFWYEFSLGGGTPRYGFDIVNREVRWFDDGRQPQNTSTFPQVGRAVASLLSLKILPDDENDKAPCIDHWRNNFVVISSFAISQRDMFDSLLRVTGTKSSDWNTTSKPSKQIYAEGKEKMAQGNRLGFAEMMYARTFFPEDNPGLLEAEFPLDNEMLGLPKEDLDEATKRAVEIAESNYHQGHYAQEPVNKNKA